MKQVSIAMVIGLGIILSGVLAFSGGAKAHEQELNVDWEVAYANVRVLTVPVYTHYTAQTLPLGGTRFVYSGVVSSSGEYPTIPTSPDPGLATGDYLTISWSFRYVGVTTVRADMFWITRLGLDFGTLGRYVNGVWVGSSSFEVVPNGQYNLTLVIRSLQPHFRHLHVGVSIQNVGNIPAAPTVSPIPPGGPTLYGVFTDASGPVVEPLQGIPVAPFGDLKLLAPWPWAVGGFVAQVVIGFVFIAAMYWYGIWERRKEAKA